GHYEAVRVIYDKNKLDFQKLTKFFLEIHDPFQHDGQGWDIGERYKSVIFYYNESQKEIACKLLKILDSSNKKIATSVLAVNSFWLAEEDHQNYYSKNKNASICHSRTIRFKG
ncbi:MAG: peptide-methionine (S)-S-oxide reductase, partial [Legionellales bacterium]|nr:peptide-methionine (S)-S-oxide reductase [Legionellales bacterium]